ncbi:HD domain-containing protein [Nocardia sp. NBC_00511]|uniref:HD domain-containing protein n=1 Tax=Nocardia sp. NBC_00511 TaxID=2903591 RepID=UPI0030E2FAB4
MEFGGDEDAARRFAEAAHGNQKYGDGPYSDHLSAVRAVLGDFGFGGEFGVAAWLHDVLEDTAVSRAELESTFGAGVTELVWAVTGVGDTREERNADIYRKIAAHPAAVVVKLADRIANVEASAGTRYLAMYQREYPEFRSRLGTFLADDPSISRMWSRLDRAIGNPT